MRICFRETINIVSLAGFRNPVYPFSSKFDWLTVESTWNMTDDESLFKEDLKKLSFGTAIFKTSFDLTAMRTDPTMKRRIKMGKRKVETINALLLTLVKYSRFIMINILLMVQDEKLISVCPHFVQWTPHGGIVSKQPFLQPV